MNRDLKNVADPDELWIHMLKAAEDDLPDAETALRTEERLLESLKYDDGASSGVYQKRMPEAEAVAPTDAKVERLAPVEPARSSNQPPAIPSMGSGRFAQLLAAAAVVLVFAGASWFTFSSTVAVADGLVIELAEPLGKDVAWEMSTLLPALDAMKAGEYQTVLRICNQHKDEFPRGQYVMERRLFEIDALGKLGYSARARAKAAGFAMDYPDSEYTERIIEDLLLPW